MSVKLYYTPINNMGDDLNRLLMEHFFHEQIADKVRIDNFDIMGIGSCLENCFYGQKASADTIKVIGKKIFSSFHGTCHIWGTGFLEEYPFDKMKLIRNNTRFDVVRGELTRRGVSRILGHELDVPLADGGLLAPVLMKNKVITKSGKIGIIPHYREKNVPAVQRLMQAVGEKALFIDVQDDSMDVLAQIASCDYVISSSLHGLIVADAFGVPNTRIKITDNLLGTGFKFDDYYSAYGIEKRAILISEDNDIDLMALFDQVQVSQKDVKEKQKVLESSMRQILKSL